MVSLATIITFYVKYVNGIGENRSKKSPIIYVKRRHRALITAAVKIGVAGHNLFDIAYAWLLAGERGVRADVEFEMLLGMAQGQIDAVAADVGPVLLYTPVVRPDEFDAAISYLVRRLEENASSENFLSVAFELGSQPALFERERERFVASTVRMTEPSLARGPRRRQDRRGAAGAGAAAAGELAASDARVPATMRPPAPPAN